MQKVGESLLDSHLISELDLIIGLDSVCLHGLAEYSIKKHLCKA